MALDSLNDAPRYEREKTIDTRHPRGARWMLVLGALAIAAIGIWLVPQNRHDRETREGGGMVVGSQSKGTARGDAKAEQQAVGTSGAHEGSAETHGGRVLTEIETITGANDATTLVGRRVDLHVDVQARANDHAFWVGSPDNRVLVVLGRDNRNGTKRQSGVPASHGIAPVRGGQRAAISGVVQAIPKKQDRHNWNLTQQDEKDLAERKIYIRADTVTGEGHGTF